MIVVMVRIPFGSTDEADALEERFRNRAGLVDSQQGFGGFELLRGDHELISMTRWETEDDLQRWMSSDANRQAHSAGGPAGPHGGHPGGPSARQGQAPAGVSVYKVVPSAGGGS